MSAPNRLPFHTAQKVFNVSDIGISGETSRILFVILFPIYVPPFGPDTAPVEADISQSDVTVPLSFATDFHSVIYDNLR